MLILDWWPINQWNYVRRRQPGFRVAGRPRLKNWVTVWTRILPSLIVATWLELIEPASGFSSLWLGQFTYKHLVTIAIRSMQLNDEHCSTGSLSDWFVSCTKCCFTTFYVGSSMHHTSFRLHQSLLDCTRALDYVAPHDSVKSQCQQQPNALKLLLWASFNQLRFIDTLFDYILWSYWK